VTPTGGMGVVDFIHAAAGATRLLNGLRLAKAKRFSNCQYMHHLLSAFNFLKTLKVS
jgi:hypothetical protein